MDNFNNSPSNGSYGKKFIFRRKIYDQMLQWKKASSGSTALIIEGSRRVGKTTVVQ